MSDRRSTLVTSLLRLRHASESGSALVESKPETGTGGSRLGHSVQRLAIACTAFTLTSCIVAAPKERADRAPATTVRGAETPLSVVVITLDGVRWHEVFEGVDPKLASEHQMAPEAVVSASELMPRLHALIDSRGAALGAPGHGATISASGPNFLSLPGYAELLSGRSATECADNQCAGAGVHTILEEMSAIAATGGEVAAVTSWSEIAKVTSLNGCRAAVSSGRRAGANRELFAQDPEAARLLAVGETAPRGVGDAEFRPDALTADIAVHHLSRHAPRFLFLGLGEPDEFAHMNDYAGYLDSIRRADARIAEVDAELQRLEAHGTRTALFITADHGRADSFVNHGAPYPESARVWLVAAGSAIGARGLVSAANERRLADITPTIRQIAHLPASREASSGSPLSELLTGAAL